MIKAVFSIVFLISSLASAQTEIMPIHWPLVPPPSQAETLLTEDMLVGLKVMQKEVRIYNYFNLPQVYDELKTLEGRNAFVGRYFASVFKRFWDLNYVTDQFINAGPGLYAAIDPLISTSFGNAVVEMTVLPGTRMINVVRPLKVRNETLQALMNEGYIDFTSKETLFKIKGQYAFSRDTLKNVTTHSLTKFRTLLHKIFQTQAINVIEYNWNTELSGFCRKHSYSAFVIIGGAENIPKVLSVPNLLIPNLTFEESSSQNRILNYKRMLEDIKAKRKAGIKVTQELKTQYFPNFGELDDLINKTYSCEN